MLEETFQVKQTVVPQCYSKGPCWPWKNFSSLEKWKKNEENGKIQPFFKNKVNSFHLKKCLVSYNFALLFFLMSSILLFKMIVMVSASSLKGI